MKNLPCSVLLLSILVIPISLFSQQSDLKPRHYLAINTAPIIVNLIDGDNALSKIGLGYKYRLNDHWKLRFMLELDKTQMIDFPSYYVFTDTVMTFLHRGDEIQNWRVSTGFERGKFDKPCYLYWGIQTALAIEEYEYGVKDISLLPKEEYFDQLLSPGSGLTYFDYTYGERGDSISYARKVKNTRFALGVPIGVGIKLQKRIEIQLEITPEAGFVARDYERRHLESNLLDEQRSNSIDFDIQQFQLLMGWKF